jgi:peptidoglycan hydrolase CwlO-like protein
MNDYSHEIGSIRVLLRMRDNCLKGQDNAKESIQSQRNDIERLQEIVRDREADVKRYASEVAELDCGIAILRRAQPDQEAS